MLTDLKRCRLEAGLRQLEICAITGIQPSRLSLLENGWLAVPPELERRIREAIELLRRPLGPGQ